VEPRHDVGNQGPVLGQAQKESGVKPGNRMTSPPLFVVTDLQR